MKAVITVIGQDTVGVVAKVSAVCAELNINIEDVSQSIMQDMFCMIMLVDLSKANAGAAEVISGLIADEAAIGMVNSKTTAVRVIPAIGHKAGDVLDFGGLLGHAPIMPISQYSPAVMIHRGGRIPAPMQALKN